MQRQIIVFFLGWLMLACSPAWAADRGALFKVAGKGHTMYLFGTIHVGQPGFYPLEPRIAAAVAGAGTLALEIDPLADPATLTQAMQAHGMHTGPGLETPMPAALRERLARALRRAGIDPNAVARLKPWLTATVLAMAEYSAQGYRTDLSVDLHLAQLAQAGKVRILALESAGSQMSMFSRMSDADQLRFMEESIALIETGRQGVEIKQIVDAWRTADRRSFDDIAERLEKDTTVSGKFVKNILLDERNVGIADKLVQLIAREDKSVAAIGVLHLIGSNSVPALLSERGLTVERVY